MQRNSKSLSLTALAAVTACLLGAASGNAALAGTVGAPANVKLVPHRAVYDMRLGDTEEQSGISALNGRMVYDFTGSECDGYSVNFRFVTEFLNVDGGSQITDLQTTSFEDGHAESYQFLSKTFVDQKLVEESRGSARIESKARTIELKQPTEKSLKIGREVLFPTEHLIAIIEAAEKGTTFLAADIYDGAETGEKVYATTSVIGAGVVDEATGSEASKAEASLKGKTFWPVTVAYFDPSEEDTSGEHLPVYQLSFHLYENGISTKMKLDYGDFTIQGKMQSLEVFEETTCSR